MSVCVSGCGCVLVMRAVPSWLHRAPRTAPLWALSTVLSTRPELDTSRNLPIYREEEEEEEEEEGCAYYVDLQVYIILDQEPTYREEEEEEGCAYYGVVVCVYISGEGACA